jgi:glycosyltransferase involved in cell wall biosynthesis
MSLSPNNSAEKTGGWLAPEFSPGLVSVVVPTHDRAALLVKTLASLRAQTWRPLEVVVVDDGSADDTQARLAGWADGGPGWKLVVLTQERRGVAAARNAGTRAASGEFIHYLDSDDLLYPDALERCVAALRGAGADYVYAAIDVADEAGRVVAGDRRWHARTPRARAFFETKWLVHGALYRRAVVAEAGPWHETMTRGEDSVFIWQAKASGRPAAYLPEVIGLYRMHSPTQLSVREEVADKCEDIVGALEVFLGWLRETGRLGEPLRRALVIEYALYGVRLGIFGRWAAKRRAFAAVRALVGERWEWRRLLLALDAVESPGFLNGLRKVMLAARWAARRRAGKG